MIQTDPLHPTEAFQARILEGRALAEAGDYDAADGHFRALLDEARGGHGGDHARALSSLVTLYGRAGRYLEAHLLARQLAAMARGAGPGAEATLAFAYGAICGALSQFRLVDPLKVAMDEMRVIMDDVPEPRRLPLELEYHEAGAGRAVVLEDPPEARRHLTAFQRAMDRSGERTPVDQWVLGMYEANVSLLEGRAEAALEHLLQVRASDVTPPFYRLQELPLSVAIRAALGQHAEARAAAEEAIAILESVQNEPFMASDRIQQGHLLARELENLGELDLAHRVYDLVAAAVMIRLKQVDECVRHLPELGLADPQSTEALSGFASSS